MALTQPTYVVNNIQGQANQVTGQATALKILFDKTGADTKTFLIALLAELASVTDSSSGADNIGATTITDLTGATIQAILESIRNKLKSTTDGSSGADFVNMTAITETGANTTVQSVIEALITRLKATTDSASGADLIGATAISGVSGATAQAIMEGLKTYIDAVAAAFVLGTVANDSITEAKMAAAMKKQAGGVAPYDSTVFKTLINALGDLIYGSADDTPSILSGNTTTTKKFLTQTGDGVNSAAPGWNSIALTDFPIIPSCRVYNSTNQSINSGALGILAFDTERWDTDTMHDTVTNNTRLTCKTAGKYYIGATISGAASAGYKEVDIRYNGTKYIAGQKITPTGGTDYIELSTLYDMAVNDYVELAFIHNHGSPINVLASDAASTQNGCDFMMVKVG